MLFPEVRTANEVAPVPEARVLGCIAEFRMEASHNPDGGVVDEPEGIGVVTSCAGHPFPIGRCRGWRPDLRDQAVAPIERDPDVVRTARTQ